MTNFSPEFLKKLANYILTKEDIEKEGVEYCGGSEGNAFLFFNDYHNSKNIKNFSLPFKHTCFCGKEDLKYNFYIRKKNTSLNFDENDYIILGSRCIKRFQSDIDLKGDYFVDDRSESELTIYSDFSSDSDSDLEDDENDDTHSDKCNDNENPKKRKKIDLEEMLKNKNYSFADEDSDSELNSFIDDRSESDITTYSNSSDENLDK